MTEKARGISGKLGIVGLSQRQGLYLIRIFTSLGKKFGFYFTYVGNH